MPGSVPSTDDTSNYDLVEKQCKENKSQHNKTAFPKLVPEKSTDICFSKEIFHGQLILGLLGKMKFLS